MLEIKGVSVKAGNFTLKEISLTIMDGDYHVIIGPTGSGQTLLLETIIGFRKAAEGEILLDGKVINDLPVEKRGFSYVPQDLALFPHLSVEDNIFYGLKVKGIKEAVSRDLIDEIIEAVGIKHLMRRGINGLSGGEKQRVALVRAIVSGHKYLLLDEPLSALHVGLRRELWFLIKELQQRYGLTILLVTHDIEEAFFLGDTISIIIDGKNHQTGRKSDVFHFPATHEVARFFGIKNLFHAEPIHFDRETITINCEELKTKLLIRNKLPNLSTNNKLILGIRPGDVMILRQDLMKENQHNLLSGTIKKVFHRGDSYTVIFLADGYNGEIEIDVPDYAFYKLNIREGQVVSVSLRSERIFLIPV